MDSQLAKYMNKDYKGAIQSLNVIQATSKDGNIYYAIDINFINGYSKRIFLQQAEQFAWCNAFDQLDTQVQVERNF